MRRTLSPRSILQHQLSVLIGCLPGIREGLDEAIHDARVATRRVGETLALRADGLDEDQLSKAVRGLEGARGALGKARDSDVMRDLLSLLDSRVPAASSLIATLRRESGQARQKARRRLIKEIEGLDLAGLPQRIARPQTVPLIFHFGHADWRARLREHIVQRAADVRHSMEHASGVYFPNRSHAARLAMKKLRYALELGQQTGAWSTPRAIRRLRKAQDTLGQAHDRQVLLDRLKPFAKQKGEGRTAVEALTAILQAEILTLYDRYLARRSDITAICDACERSARRRRSGGRALLAAGAALPALMLITRRSTPATQATVPASGDLQVKVRVSPTPQPALGSRT